MSGTREQLFRFAVVGAASNAFLYLLYLALTGGGIGHKAAMTVLYIAGVSQTFLGNRAWTFRYNGDIYRTLTRYFLAYAGCYLFNLALLYVLVDLLDLSHQWVQGGAIAGIAMILFVLQKYWVFRRGDLRGMGSAP